MEIISLASESFGVRSMCTYVKTKDISILIDPGVALGYRFGLLPHPEEYKKRMEVREKINQYAQCADIIIITHYHHDHYTPAFTEHVLIGSIPEYSEMLYKDKILLVKDFKSKINPSQRRRGWFAHKIFQKLGEREEFVDGKSFQFSETDIFFSDPVPHGEKDNELGWVLMVGVKDTSSTFLFTSDVQGPMDLQTTNQILGYNPDVVFIGGPPVYLKDYRVSSKSLDHARDNLIKLGEKISTIIVDHHLLRDENWVEYLHPIRTSLPKGKKIMTMAEYQGLEVKALEYQRTRLYQQYPPSDDFLMWTKKVKRLKKGGAPPPPLN